MTDAELRKFKRNLPMALLRARETVMGRFRPLLRDMELTEQQWRVIRALYGSGGMEATVLAERTILLMPSLTRILKTLEEQKLIRRETVQGDNRRKLIKLAERGRAIHAKMAPLSEAEYRKLENAVGLDKLDTLYELLGAVSQINDTKP